MSDKIRLYSEIEQFEIININNGEKYNNLSNNDIIIDEEGNLKLLILNENKLKFGLFGKQEFSEVPWDYVKKIGTRTIIIDIEENMIKKTNI